MARRRGSGEGSIYKEGNRWVASITLESDGKRQVRRKRFARTQAEARDKLRDLQAEARAGVIGAKGMTVAEFLKDWLANVLPARGVTPATIANYSAVLNGHVIPCIGTKKLEQLRAEHVETALRKMADAGKSRNTMRVAKTVLAQALTHAERRDLVMRNAARLAVLPTGPKKEPRSLTADEARALLQAVKGHRLEAAVVTMLGLGLRPGEVLGLSWEAVDLDSRRLTIAQALRRAPGRNYLGAPKTPKSRRTLDLPDLVVDALVAHGARQAIERAEAGDLWEDQGLVFPSVRGTLMDPRNFRRQIEPLATSAGIKDFHPHLLRHTATSLLSDAGVPLEQIADLLGHSTTSMTEGVYRHPVSASVNAHVTAVDTILGPCD